MKKKKTPNKLKTDPVSVLCQKRGIGRSIAEEIVKREQQVKTIKEEKS